MKLRDCYISPVTAQTFQSPAFQGRGPDSVLEESVRKF